MGEHCHPNCNCGRYLEIGNSVFMEFVKQADSSFTELPTKNVDFGGGLERIAAANLNDPDIYKISLIWPIIEKLQAVSNQSYDANDTAMRVIADHMRAATFLAVDGITPSNKGQGYVMRRLLRRAIRYALDIGIEQDLSEKITPLVVDIYKEAFSKVSQNAEQVVNTLVKEEKIFRQTLRKGLKVFARLVTGEAAKNSLMGSDIFQLYDTYGFPVELSVEEAKNRTSILPMMPTANLSV
jgi:alanyl-tRNA synthetase